MSTEIKNENMDLDNPYKEIKDPEKRTWFPRKSQMLNKWAPYLRLQFIRKVYGIVTVQLLITSLFCLLAITWDAYVIFQQNYSWTLYIGVAGMLLFPLFTIFGVDYLRQVPTNYILLFGYNICISYVVSYICATTDKTIVLMAFGVTFSISFLLTIYTLFKKSEVQVKDGFFFTSIVMLIIFLILWFVFDINFIKCLVCCLCVTIFSLYLIYDTKLIMANFENAGTRVKKLREERAMYDEEKGAYLEAVDDSKELSEDDYILGAFLIFTDIIMMFMEVLELISLICRSDD